MPYVWLWLWPNPVIVVVKEHAGGRYAFTLRPDFTAALAARSMDAKVDRSDTTGEKVGLSLAPTERLRVTEGQLTERRVVNNFLPKIVDKTMAKFLNQCRLRDCCEVTVPLPI